MNILSRERIAEVTSGQALQGSGGEGFTNIFTDTRKPVIGGLFFALDGPNFNAHSFLGMAVQSGAKGLVISDAQALPAGIPADLFVVLVQDTRHALGQVAKAARMAHEAKFIAITGSVGKTTMKNMVAAALAPFGKVGRTPGNFNNDIGLPLTLCGLDGDEDFVVLELGMNAPGEIHTLTTLAVPDVGLVTGAHAAHLEFFPDVDAIADAKSELYATIDTGSYAIANGDDHRIQTRANELHPENLLSYGLSDGVTVRATSIRSTDQGIECVIKSPSFQGTVIVPALGEHHALHAAGALAVVEALGLDVEEAARAITSGFHGEKHRMSLLATHSGVTILDDCYNASPLSMQAALQTFGSLAQSAHKRVAVLGSMLELGDAAPHFHQEAGKLAARVGVDHLFALGPYASDLAKGAAREGLSRATEAGDVSDVMGQIVDTTEEDSWLLLKGSRGGRLERVLNAYNVMEAR